MAFSEFSQQLFARHPVFQTENNFSEAIFVALIRWAVRLSVGIQ